MDIHNPELLEKVRKYALEAEKKSRYEHSVRVAQTAAFLCRQFGLDEQKGYFAGLAHDLCKEMNEDLLVSLSSHDGMPFLDEELKKPSLLHGRAAAVKLAQDFGVEDKDVLQAVALHTLGGENMSDLAKIIYIADKVEPGRPQSTEKYREKLFALSLNRMCLKVLEENMEYLKKKGKTIAPSSFVLKKALLASIENEENSKNN